MGGNIDIDAIEVALLRVVMLCVDTAVLVCFLDRVGGYFRDAAATTASTATATGDEAVESDIDGALVVVAVGGDGADMMMRMKDAE